MFLITVVLLLHLSAEGISQPIPLTYEEYNSQVIQFMNGLRYSVATGKVVSNNWGYVNEPASAHIFILEYSPEMGVYAEINVQGCQSSNFIPPGGSLNFGGFQLSDEAYSANAIDSLSTTNNHISRAMPQDYNYTMFDPMRFDYMIANHWFAVLKYNLTDSQGQVIYNNKTMEPLANMIYYKATKAACAVQQCNYTYVTACAFDKAPQWGKPIYMADPHASGCSTDEDCTSIINGTICTTGTWAGLCGYKVPATTTSTTTSQTEIATSAPETSAPLRATATSAAGKTTSAAGSTKSIGTTKETEPSSTVATTTSQSEYIIKLINEMRAEVANGNISTSYGSLPSSLHMFQLEYSPELEVYAQINTIQCQNKKFTPSGSSMNYYTFYETPGNNLNRTIVINLALASWMEEILNTNFGSQVTYTNQNLQEFANMMYYKSTKAGCAYQKCNQPAPPRAVVACVFNSAPQTGKPIYLGTAGVTGCNNDGDCISVFNGTKCGPQGLCGYSFTTTTKLHSTASTAPVTTPATEKATPGAATGTPLKAATVSTKGTGTPSEASSASTQGTGASSKAASASTQGTEAYSKAATASTKGTGTPSKASSASTQGTGPSSKAATASTQGTGASSKAATASTQGTGTPSKAASGSTKGTGASSKVATASTQGTGASSKAATASTQGTGTPSKAASASTRGTGASSKAASTSTRGTTTPSAVSTSISEKTTAAATTTQTVLTTTAAAKLNQSELFIELINGFREKVAKGDLSTSNGPLPSSLQMFQVEYSPELEVYAKINTIQCQTENFTPPGSSMNYYTFYETPGDNLSNITVINLALASWMQEILNTNFGSQVTYTNQNMKDFANMIYYKSTKAGCAYQQCNQPAPPRAVVACIFNSAPQLGKPIYPGTQGVNGCNKDSDCSAVISGTTCGPQGLCGYSFS